MNGGKNASGVVVAFRLGSFAGHRINRTEQVKNPAINFGRSGASPYQRAAATASPYRFFSICRKNGAVLLTLLFATSSGEPVATTSPPNSPASGPISMR